MPARAFAQRVEFSRTFAVSGPSRLDVTTENGKIDVVTGHAGLIVVSGAATVKIGWNVPANAVEIAQQVAAAPPIEQTGVVVCLHLPAADEARRAVTVSYRVEVPPDTEVRSVSDSGATMVRGVTAPVTMQTQSGAISVSDLGGAVQITTGSGAVDASHLAGALTVTTASGGFTGARLGSSLTLRTKSGDVRADFSGRGDVDVETGSSAINLRGVNGALGVKTQSGRVTVDGTPAGDWNVTTSSSEVSLGLGGRSGFAIDASSRSGDITVEGFKVDGSTEKHVVRGNVAGGGPAIKVRTGSGAIHMNVGAR